MVSTGLTRGETIEIDSRTEGTLSLFPLFLFFLLLGPLVGRISGGHHPTAESPEKTFLGNLLSGFGRRSTRSRELIQLFNKQIKPMTNLHLESRISDDRR